MDTKERIIELLESTKREGMDKMIEWLKDEGFFESPASTRFHGSYVGGLAEHSLAVYHLMQNFASEIDFGKKITWGQMPMKVEPENIIIACLLHDVCKVGAYVPTKAGDGWANNRNKDKGHALLSIERIEHYIELAKLERMMIKYHMGIYGLKEYDPKTGEYPLTSGEDTEGMTQEQKVASQKRRYGKSMRNAWYHNPIVKLMYFCDELATMQEKANECNSETTTAQVPATSTRS